MARPNAKQNRRRVEREVENLTDAEIAAKISTYSAEIGHKPNEIQTLTMRALVEVLEHRQKRSQSAVAAAAKEQAEAEESLRKQRVLETMQGNVANATSFLSTLNDTPAWSKLMFRDPADTFSKTDLIEWAENADISFGETRVPSSLGVSRSKASLTIAETPELIGSSLEHIAINHDEKRMCPVLSTANRTPEWRAIQIMSRVAQGIYLSRIPEELLTTTPFNTSEITPYLNKALSIGASAQCGIVTEMGGKVLTETIESIWRPLATDPQNFWGTLEKNWFRIQRSLDNCITLKPPQSVHEAIERTDVYLTTLQNLSGVPDKVGSYQRVFTRTIIEAKAREIFQNVPQKVENSSVIQEFPHYDATVIGSNNIVWAREGSETIFLVPASDYSGEKLSSSDLVHGECKNPLVTKQRVAALVPEYDPKTYKNEDWVSGTLLDSDHLTVTRAKHNFTEGLLAARKKLSDKAVPPQYSTDLSEARWFLGGKGQFESNSSVQCLVNPQQDRGTVKVTLEFHGTQNNERKLSMRDEPAHPLWRGIAVNNALYSTHWAGNPQKLFDAGYIAVVQQLQGQSQLVANIRALKSSLATTGSDLDPWTMEMTCIERVMKMMNRLLTRVPPKSSSELATRFELARYMWKIVTENTLPKPLVIADKDALFARDALFPEIPEPITTKNDEHLEKLMTTLGIESSAINNVRFLREGPKKMRFVCRRESHPPNRIFHRSVEIDEEITLDNVVTADESLDETIENERGLWVSGTLPTVEELENEYLQIVDVQEKVVDEEIPREPVKRTRSADEHEEREKETELQQSIKVRCIRDALLRLSIDGKIGVRKETSAKPTFAFDTKTVGGSYESGAGTQGKTVIIVPEAAVAFVVSQERKTRVIYNATMSPDAFSTMSIDAIDDQYGKHEITFNDEHQFRSNVIQCIESRIDPQNRLTIYPVLSPKNPSPIQEFPSPESLRFLLSIFSVARSHSNKSLRNLQVADFQKILSGAQGITWPLGGGHTAGITILRYIYQELSRTGNAELKPKDEIHDIGYREAKAAFELLKPLLIAQLAADEPSADAIDAQRSATSNSANATLDSEVSGEAQ